MGQNESSFSKLESHNRSTKDLFGDARQQQQQLGNSLTRASSATCVVFDDKALNVKLSSATVAKTKKNDQSSTASWKRQRALSLLSSEEQQELDLLQKAISAWQGNDVTEISTVESQLRLNLVDPATETKSQLEAEVKFLRQQLERSTSLLLEHQKTPPSSSMKKKVKIHSPTIMA